MLAEKKLQGQVDHSGGLEPRRRRHRLAQDHQVGGGPEGQDDRHHQVHARRTGCCCSSSRSRASRRRTGPASRRTWSSPTRRPRRRRCSRPARSTRRSPGSPTCRARWRRARPRRTFWSPPPRPPTSSPTPWWRGRTLIDQAPQDGAGLRRRLVRRHLGDEGGPAGHQQADRRRAQALGRRRVGHALGPQADPLRRQRALLRARRARRPYFDSLFNGAFVIWRKKGVVNKVVDAQDWTDARFVAALADQYKSQKVEESFAFKDKPKVNDRAIVNKSLSIHFTTGSDEIMPGSYFTLDSLGETMLAFGNTYLQVEGNTDSRGSRAANKTLSQKRAESVKAYLVKNFTIDPEALRHRRQGLVEPAGAERDRGRPRARTAARTSRSSSMPSEGRGRADGPRLWALRHAAVGGHRAAAGRLASLALVAIVWCALSLRAASRRPHGNRAAGAALLPARARRGAEEPLAAHLRRRTCCGRDEHLHGAHPEGVRALARGLAAAGHRDGQLRRR